MTRPTQFGPPVVPNTVIGGDPGLGDGQPVTDCCDDAADLPDRANGGVTFVGIASDGGTLVQSDTSVSAGSGISLAYPSDTTAGNTLVAVLIDRGGGSTPITPVGWNFVNNGGKVDPDEGTMYWRVAPGGPVTVAFTTPNNEVRLYVMEFSGGGSGVVDTSRAEAHTTSSTFTLPNVTVTAAAVLVGDVLGGDGPPNPLTFTEDAAFTNVGQGHVGSGLNPESNVGYRIVSAGTYGYAPTANHSTVYGGVLAAFDLGGGWAGGGQETVDGDDATYDTIVGPNVLRIDLGAPFQIARMRLRIGTATSGSRTYTLKGATLPDFSDAVTVDTVTFTATGSYTAQDVTDSWVPTAAYQYWELIGNDETRRIFSFELYEAAAVTLGSIDLDTVLGNSGGEDIADALTGAASPAAGNVFATMADVGATVALPWSYAQADGGLHGDGSTDDTTLFQAWITSVTASGTKSGWFWFEPGTYLIGGALQDTGAFNAQILLPNVSTSANQITLTFQGAARPPYAFHGTSAPTAQGYSIIKSTLTGASGTAAVISAGNGSAPAQTNISTVWENLIFLGPDNPTFTFLNLQDTQGGAIKDVQIATSGGFASSPVQPTHSNSYGIKLPRVYNSNYTYVDGLSVGAYYTGVLQGELAVIRGLILGVCIVGIELPTSIHASLIVDMHQSGCPTGIKVTGLHYCDILQYDAEHYVGNVTPFPTWMNPIYDLDDGSNNGHGAIRFVLIDNDGSGPSGWSVDHTFVKNGGTGFSAAEVGPIAVATGTVTSVAATVPAEFSISGSPITSSGTLAITKATETANTVWAGPTTGSAAQPTFRALVAADIAGLVSASGVTDHEHVQNVVFSGDASTTVWELPAAPVDATSIAVFVTGSRSIAWVLSGAMLTTLTFDSAPASAANNIVIDIVAATA